MRANSLCESRACGYGVADNGGMGGHIIQQLRARPYLTNGQKLFKGDGPGQLRMRHLESLVNLCLRSECRTGTPPYGEVRSSSKGTLRLQKQGVTTSVSRVLSKPGLSFIIFMKPPKSAVNRSEVKVF